MLDLEKLILLPILFVVASCGLSPSEPPNFEQAMECASINALAGEGEANSEEAELATKWLAYAARQPGQSKQSVAERHDQDWEALINRFQDMSETEILSFSTQVSFRCVGFEETYTNELDGVSSKKS